MSWVDALAEEVAEKIGARQAWDSPLDLASHVDPGYVRRDHLTYLSERLTKAAADVEAAGADGNGYSEQMEEIAAAAVL